MTREEAIEKLELLRQKVDEDTYRALIMAIKTLEQEPCDDAISREEVADMLTELVEMIDTGSQRDLDRADELSRQIMSAIKPCDDAISREAAIKAECDVCAIGGGYDKCQYFMQGCNEIECIRALPSVQPSRKGHWIEQEDFNGDTYYDCSECKESFCLMDGTPTDNLYNFCPYCGADMRGAE